MKLSRFRKKHRGRRVSGYTTSGGQCVDLARAWAEDQYGDPYDGLPRVFAARDLWAKADRKKWRRVRYDGTNKPSTGDLVIWGHGRYGHVAIARARCTRRVLLTFDQNWSRPRLCTDERHTYANVIGWLERRNRR